MFSNKNKSILIQTILIITVLFCAAVATNGLAIFYSGSDFYMADLIENKRRLTHYVENIMMRYESISWLLDYWLENYELIDTSRSSKDLQKYSVVPPEYLINNKSIMLNEISILTPEQQFLFAEYCYREIMSDFDDIKTILKPYILYCVRPLENRKNTAFVFFNAVDRNNNDEFIKEQLGTIWSLNMSKHPVIKSIYDTGQETDEFEFVKVRDEEIVYGYMPLKFDGKILCHITAAFLLDDVKEAIYKNIISVEIKNAMCLILAGIFLAFLLFTLIVRPLEKVQLSVREFTRRKDSASIVEDLATIKSRNEIGRLADDVSLLAVTLEQYNEQATQLSAQQARIDTELSLAAKIQEGVLPKNFPNVKEFSLYATTIPAREVGGDFYDFFMIDEDHIALVIGDVSGKGFSAALFMMTAKTVLKDCVQFGDRTIQDIIREVNDKLCESNEAFLFVTLWFGIMTISTGEIIYVNAGHQFPALRRAGERFKIFEDVHARPLAILPNLIFASGTIKLNAGDTLFLYTDGVIEADNENDDLFGESGLIDALNLSLGLPQEIASTVLNSVNDFHGKRPQFDDITMLCVK
ncbi:MAG: PP2C family protein-serine/threonine phosphatase, partial [Synergistaceae bacterium]|nr:PP2C family protein-serine/threonine phosphatase [Synergistaceae bacterium]